MRIPKFDIEDRVVNIEDLYNKNKFIWRYNNAPKESVFTIEEIIINNKGILYKIYNKLTHSTFIAKENELISEKDFIKILKEKFKK